MTDPDNEYSRYSDTEIAQLHANYGYGFGGGHERIDEEFWSRRPVMRGELAKIAEQLHDATVTTDDVDAPDTMTAAAFKSSRESLGLSVDWLAAKLGVSSRSVEHWERGTYPVSASAADTIRRIEAETSRFVRDVVDELSVRDRPTVTTYRTPADFEAACPKSDLSASWHRAAVARIAREIPAATIVFAPPVQ